MSAARTERCSPAGSTCPCSSSPLRLSYLHTHLSLTCSRVTCAATALENGQQTFALRVWGDSRVLGLGVCTFLSEILTGSCGVYVLIGCRLWWQADASDADSPKFITLSIPSGKHHSEFLFIYLFISAHIQTFTCLFTVNTHTHTHVTNLITQSNQYHILRSSSDAGVAKLLLSFPCFRAVL